MLPEGSTIKFRALCHLLAGVLLIVNKTSAEIPVVPLATGEWAPYTSQAMDRSGAFTEIVSAAFHEMKMEPFYKFYPWKRAERYTELGKVFAVFPYRITSERQKLFDFSDAVMFSTGRFFYKEQSFPDGINYQQFEDLSSYKIVGVLGYWYEKSFTEANLNVQFVGSDADAITLLFNDRTELVACEELVGWTLIKKHFPRSEHLFTVASKPLNRDPLRLMISKNYPNAAGITKEFNAALEKLRSNGMLSQILQKYGIRE